MSVWDQITIAIYSYSYYSTSAGVDKVKTANKAILDKAPYGDYVMHMSLVGLVFVGILQDKASPFFGLWVTHMASFMIYATAGILLLQSQGYTLPFGLPAVAPMAALAIKYAPILQHTMQAQVAAVAIKARSSADTVRLICNVGVGYQVGQILAGVVAKGFKGHWLFGNEANTLVLAAGLTLLAPVFSALGNPKAPVASKKAPSVFGVVFGEWGILLFAFLVRLGRWWSMESVKAIAVPTPVDGLGFKGVSADNAAALINDLILLPLVLLPLMRGSPSLLLMCVLMSAGLLRTVIFAMTVDKDVAATFGLDKPDVKLPIFLVGTILNRMLYNVPTAVIAATAHRGAVATTIGVANVMAYAMYGGVPKLVTGKVIPPILRLFPGYGLTDEMVESLLNVMVLMISFMVVALLPRRANFAAVNRRQKQD